MATTLAGILLIVYTAVICLGAIILFGFIAWLAMGIYRLLREEWKTIKSQAKTKE